MSQDKPTYSIPEVNLPRVSLPQYTLPTATEPLSVAVPLEQVYPKPAQTSETSEEAPAKTEPSVAPKDEGAVHPALTIPIPEIVPPTIVIPQIKIPDLTPPTLQNPTTPPAQTQPPAPAAEATARDGEAEHAGPSSAHRGVQGLGKKQPASEALEDQKETPTETVDTRPRGLGKPDSDGTKSSTGLRGLSGSHSQIHDEATKTDPVARPRGL